MSCYSLAYEQVLSRNILYRYRWSIALIVAIFCSVGIQQKIYKKEDFFGRIILPLVILFLTLFIIKIITEMGLDTNEVEEKASKCFQAMNQENFMGLREPNYGIWNNPALSPNLIPFNPQFQPQPLQKKMNSEGVREVVNETDDEDMTKDKEDFADLDQQGMMYDNKSFMAYHRNGYDQINYVKTVADKAAIVENNGINMRPDEACALGCKNSGQLCPGVSIVPEGMVAPMPGPQWQPQSAEYVQRRLKNKNYTIANPLDLFIGA